MAAEIAIRITGVNDADNALKGATKGVKDFDDAAKKAGGGIDAFREISIGALRAVGEAALNMAVQGGQALAGFLKDSVDAAGTFEESINGLQAVAGSSLEAAGYSFDDVSAKALQLGKDTQFSAQQSIQAMTELVKGGVPVEDVMNAATDATLALAAAGGVELVSAAEIVAKSLGVWGATGATAASVTDAIAAAANASTLDVEGFAGAMFNAQGRAAALNMSFEDFATAIAMISPGFKSGETAGTSYNAFLSRLIPNTKKATQAMVELGLITEDGANVFFDQEGAFVGNREAARLLQDAFKDLNTEQALTYKDIIFGTDAMGAANMYIQEGAAGYDEMTASMAAAGGAAEVAATMQQGYAFAMDQFGGSVETLQIILGTKLLPALTGVIGMFTGLVNVVMPFAEGDMFGGLTSLGMWLSENVNPALGNFVTNLAIATDPMQKLKDAVLSFLTQVAAQLPGYLLAWAAALAGWVWNALPGLLSNLAALVVSLMTWAMGAGATLRTALVQWAGYFGQWVLDALPGLGTNLAALVQSLYTWIGAQLPGLVALLAIWGQRFFQWVIDAAPPLLRELGAFLASMLAWLIASMPAITAQLAIWGEQFISWLVAVVPPLLVAAGELLAELLAWLISNQPAIQKELEGWGKAFVEWIIAAAPGMLQELGGLWNQLQGWISEAVGKLSADGSVGRALVEGIKSGIAQAIGGLLAAARDMATRAIQTSMDALGISSPSKVAAQMIGKPFAEGVASGIVQYTPVVQAAGAFAGMAAVGGARGSTTNNTTNYNYAPTYSATPASPSADFAAMRALARV